MFRSYYRNCILRMLESGLSATFFMHADSPCALRTRILHGQIGDGVLRFRLRTAPINVERPLLAFSHGLLPLAFTYM